MTIIKPSLQQMYKVHQGKESDKWSLYLEEYDRLFSPIREHRISLLEIGVQNGGSLEIWSKYFHNAEKIVGCDIDEKCKCLRFEDPRISVIIGDANTDTVQIEITAEPPPFNIIIDDGSHKSSDVIQSFFRYFPLLSKDGIYIAEDLHTSYWADYEGGLHNPHSAISFFKRLVDIVNYKHWRNGKPSIDILSGFSNYFDKELNSLFLEKIHSVEFINSLCIIRAATPSKNELGSRVIAGLETCVTDPHLSLNNISILDLEVRIENDSALDVLSLMAEVENLNGRLIVLDSSILQMNDLISNLQEELSSKNEQIISCSLRESNQKEQIASLKADLDRQTGLESNLAEFVETQRGKVAGLELALSSAESKVNALEDEVVHYASSKSWKYTRPFRKLYGNIRRLVR